MPSFSKSSYWTYTDSRLLSETVKWGSMAPGVATFAGPIVNAADAALPGGDNVLAKDAGQASSLARTGAGATNAEVQPDAPMKQALAESPAPPPADFHPVTPLDGHSPEGHACDPKALGAVGLLSAPGGGRGNAGDGAVNR